MIEIILNYLSNILLLIGCFFILTGSVGILKLPDLFSRIHAAGLIDTLGSFFVVISLIIFSGFTLTSLKLLLIPLFLLFTSPISGHAIALIAFEAGHQPNKKFKKK